MGHASIFGIKKRKVAVFDASLKHGTNLRENTTGQMPLTASSGRGEQCLIATGIYNLKSFLHTSFSRVQSYSASWALSELLFVVHWTYLESSLSNQFKEVAMYFSMYFCDSY